MCVCVPDDQQLLKSFRLGSSVNNRVVLITLTNLQWAADGIDLSAPSANGILIKMPQRQISVAREQWR